MLTDQEREEQRARRLQLMAVKYRAEGNEIAAKRCEAQLAGMAHAVS